jgi:ParB/RepB/Spo0J family partition protein
VFQTIPIEKIVPAKDNVRRRPGEIKELAASVASVGVIEPLLVSPGEDGTFVVVAGHRRLLAARQAGLSELPCTVRDLTDPERVEIMLAENVARCSLTPTEEASGYFRLIEFGLPLAEVGRRIGRSARHISSRLALLELPRTVQAKIDSGKVTVAEASALLTIRQHPDVIDRLLEDEWSRGDLERAVVREAARIEAEAKVASAREALEAEGVAVVEEWTRYGGRSRQPVAIGTGHGELDVKPARHRLEPCHAAHVTRSGEVVWLCTEPGRHRPGGESKVEVAPGAAPTRDEERADEREQTKRRRQEERDRLAFAAGLVIRRLPKGDTAALVVTQFLATAGSAQARTACGLLGIDPVEDGYGPNHRTALQRHAAGSTADRDRAALALALAAGEESVRYGTPGRFAAAALAHLDFLASYGWSNPETGDGPDPATDEINDSAA